MSVELADFKTLALRRQGSVLHISLNRPEVRNAMSMTMVRELQAALGQSEMRDNTRAIVLRGHGGHFCAGADLADVAQARSRLQENPKALEQTNAAFGHLCSAYANSGLAIVAVVEGTCMGGGFGLACVADVTLASPTAVFRLPETSLGLVPAQIAPFLVERLGYAEAKRLSVTGARLGAAEALGLRLVHGVHEGAALDEALQRTLADIMQCAPGALAATKNLLRKARLQAADQLVQEAAEVFSSAALGAEGAEGVAAFLEKRKPRWAQE